MSQTIPKRLMKEIQDAKSAIMEEQGIFYEFDEVNIMSGRAMMVGPEETPYEGCLLCFSIQYPGDYPFSSPLVRIITSDGFTRFHPNLYVDGKVCLSILGTWRGPPWAPVMTISTVLNTIQSILEANPIINEPGHETLKLAGPDSRARDYAELVQFRLVSHTFRGLSMWAKGILFPEWKGFEDVLREHGERLMANLGKVIARKAEEEDKNYERVLYSMHGKTEWKHLLNLWKAEKLRD
jgi:ubiquitin-protein ligase